MRVTAVFYARLTDLAGGRERVMDLPAGATAAAAWRLAVEASPGLDAMSGRVSVAINAEFARLESLLGEGDEIAFLPPVSGGSGRRS